MANQNLHHSDGRIRLLDLCCKAGGCTKGYQRAGFYVVGVDKDPQPNYCGDDFIQRDALAMLEDVIDGWGMGYSAIHASFPCQSKTAYRRKGHGVGDGYPNLVPAGREMLERTGLPYVIENVEGFREALEQIRDGIFSGNQAATWARKAIDADA